MLEKHEVWRIVQLCLKREKERKLSHEDADWLLHKRARTQLFDETWDAFIILSRQWPA